MLRYWLGVLREIFWTPFAWIVGGIYAAIGLYDTLGSQIFPNKNWPTIYKILDPQMKTSPLSFYLCLFMFALTLMAFRYIIVISLKLRKMTSHGYDLESVQKFLDAKILQGEQLYRELKPADVSPDQETNYMVDLKDPGLIRSKRWWNKICDFMKHALAEGRADEFKEYYIPNTEGWETILRQIHNNIEILKRHRSRLNLLDISKELNTNVIPNYLCE